MAPDQQVLRSMARAESYAGRPLAGLEHAMRITEDTTPFNVVAVLRLEGDLPPANIRVALDRLQQRHPLLRSRIVPAGRAFSFRFDVAHPIPLEVAGRAGTGGWIAAAETELHRGFELTTGPLARCRYVPTESGADLLVTIHHSIVDAVSAPHLLGELLTMCAGAADADVTAPRASSEAAAVSFDEGALPASALFPTRYSGVGLKLATAAFMARQMADETKFRWRSRGVRAPAIAAEGRCRLLPVRFDADLTAALIRASRRERVTLNAVLSAGLIAAVQRCLYESASAPLRHIVFTDLRSRLRTKVPERALGCFLSMLRLTVMVPRNGGFWPLARDVQDSTMRAARSGERYLSYVLSPGMMKMILGLRAFRMGATALSYSGPVRLPARYGAIELTEVHAFATNITLGPEYSALVRLFRDELWWDILYLDSDMDDARAREISREMKAILERAAC